MNNRNFTTRFAVDQSPQAVFKAISQVRAWWSDGIEGRTENVGDRFTHRVLDLHRCDLEVTEAVPGKKVVWTVLDNYFSFTKDDTEWKGTNIVFEIGQVDTKTELKFTHVGFVPSYECYDVCVDGWTTYTQSLYSLITTGKGQPNVGAAKTDSEVALARAKEAS